MTPNHAPPGEGEPRDRTPLEDDAALHRELQHLLGGASRPQLWLFFLDPEGRLIDPIMPMDDHPLEPDEPLDSGDLGRVPFARAFVHRAAQVAEAIGAGSFAVVQERTGADALTASDLRWVRALVAHAGAGTELGAARLRAVFLLHDRGLRQIAPDDYA